MMAIVVDLPCRNIKTRSSQLCVGTCGWHFRMSTHTFVPISMDQTKNGIFLHEPMTKIILHYDRITTSAVYIYDG
jgi:hypothetical protein